ncbi:MAG TPA: hypothetical protein VHB97_18725, partial [Polyangia bacterium]|nr:hypothetical protein [Polyangia bacterium]
TARPSTPMTVTTGRERARPPAARALAHPRPSVTKSRRDGRNRGTMCARVVTHLASGCGRPVAAQPLAPS